MIKIDAAKVEKSKDGRMAVITVTSDKPDFSAMLEELTSPDAKRAAISYAASNLGMINPGYNGTPRAVALNKNGIPLDAVRGVDGKRPDGKHPDMAVAGYEAKIRVMAGVF